MTPRKVAALFAAAALACGAWALCAGKDLNWDLLHYHTYIAYALLDGRLQQDYFAASGQSYLNPLGYVPFYLMQAAGWHSALVSLLLAAVHGAGVAMLFLITWRLSNSLAPMPRAILSALGALLGAASAVFLATVGTSFLEPLLALPMLAAVFLLIGEDRARADRGAFWAGILFGIAAALKYSNAFFALAALFLVAASPAASRAARARSTAAYAAGGAISVALLAGPWMLRLAREFGNPFFPHVNSLFRAPDMPPITFAADRFAPDNVVDAVAFPFRLLSPEAMTYAEISAPDLRLAAIVIAAIALAAVSRLRRPAAADLRFFAFFALCAAAWIGTSANGRYGMLVLLLAGPCLARLAEDLLPMRHAGAALGALLAAQTVMCAMISPARWFYADRWSARWLEFAVPERAEKEPALYLSVETQALASLAPFVDRGSAFMNLRGEFSLPPDSRRVRALLARFEGRARAYGRALRLQAGGRPRPEIVELYDATLLRYGLRIDPADCFRIEWRAGEADALSRWANAVAGEPRSAARALEAAACRLVPGQRDPREIEEERRMSAVFDRIEAACPGLFRGQSALTERLGGEWSRTYVSPEARMETHAGRVLLVPAVRLRYVDLGPLAAWERGDALSAGPAIPGCAPPPSSAPSGGAK